MINRTDILFFLDKIATAVSGVSTSIDNKKTPIVVTDITALTGEQLDSLEVGDKVIKHTTSKWDSEQGKMVPCNVRHLYLVSYKGEDIGDGICLSYNATGYGETVAYDRTENGWVYNSTDVMEYAEKA